MKGNLTLINSYPTLILRLISHWNAALYVYDLHDLHDLYDYLTCLTVPIILIHQTVVLF